MPGHTHLIRTIVRWRYGLSFFDVTFNIHTRRALEDHAAVVQVKPLGVYAMIDDGELDWKIIAISTSDPLADKLNDVEDVERCARCCGLVLLRYFGKHARSRGMEGSEFWRGS